MTVATQPALRLRPHHFLCILTYAGKGYTHEFVENLDDLVERLSDGERTVEIVSGPDDICGPMMKCQDHPQFHCLRESVDGRDEAALREIPSALEEARLSGANHLPDAFAVGSRIRVTPELVAVLRDAFARRTIRTACNGCEWDDACTWCARTGFANTVLHPPDDLGGVGV